MRTPWLLALLVVLALASGGCERKVPASTQRPAPDAGYLSLWESYRQAFIRDGRVIDVDNGGITHSEAQGYGMLLAEAAGDRPTFDRLLDWTLARLQRSDGLLAWRFGPCPAADARAAVAAALGREPIVEHGQCVNDANNASDGDILVAWALIRAAERWDEPRYLNQARRLAAATIRHSLIPWNQGLLLLPGTQGFVHPPSDGRAGYLVVNPSYWVFPALDDLARVFPDQPWETLAQSGQTLLRQARFGAMGLPPDWLAVDPSGGTIIGPAPGFDPVYGFNALRIPLHLTWGRKRWQADNLKPFLAWWAHFPNQSFPAWVDLHTGTTAEFGASAGAQAIARFVRSVSEGLPPERTEWPQLAQHDRYYSWSLAMLTRIAAQETDR